MLPQLKVLMRGQCLVFGKNLNNDRKLDMLKEATGLENVLIMLFVYLGEVQGPRLRESALTAITIKRTVNPESLLFLSPSILERKTLIPQFYLSILNCLSIPCRARGVGCVGLGTRPRTFAGSC